MKKTGEYGEFFPPEYSPFGYNETTAFEAYPMTKEEVLAKGLKWKEKDEKEYSPATYELPDKVADTPDSVMKETLACSDCGKNYRIIDKELSFHKEFNYPLPRKCPYCRLKYLYQFHRDLKFHDRQCVKCGKDVQISIPEGRREIIYCEECYQKEIY